MRLAVINLLSSGISGGYQKYLTKILPRLKSHRDVKALLCALPLSVKLHPSFGKDFGIIKCNPYHPLRYYRDFELDNKLKKFKPDIIFIPVERYFHYDKIPVVNLVQNMEPFIKKNKANSFKTNLRLTLQKYVGEHAIKKSNGVIALSNYVKKMLIEDINIPEERIALIYHGINKVRCKERKPPLLLKELTGDFIFTAGSIRPARGIEDLVNALCELKNENINLPLVIAGKLNKGMEKYSNQIRSMIYKYELSNSIIWAGALSNQEMAWCYQNSKIFIMTSRVESFGMIAGEAMANGCVCISSDSPCLPEIFNDCGLTYKAGNAKDLANKIKGVLDFNTAQREKMSSKAILRARQFSWDICASRTIDFLSRMANCGGN